MQYRRLGRADIRVSEIGLGAWGIGGISTGSTSYGHIDDSVAVRTIEKALELGVNFFDTSNVYGDGRSEKILGRVLKKKRDRVFISTKVGLRTFNEKIRLNANEIYSSVDESLKRLGTDYVDVLHLHKISTKEIEEAPKVIGILESLICTGKVRFLAISLNNPDEIKKRVVFENFPIIQTNFSLLDMRLALRGSIDYIEKYDIGVLCRTPFNFGFLAKNYALGARFLDPDHRSTWPQKQIDQWISGANLLYSTLGLNDLDDVPKRVGLAIQFCLAFPQISSVLVGSMNENEMAMNVDAAECTPLSEADIESAFTAFAEWESRKSNF